MDAIFVPLASATGASLDQVKVCGLSNSRSIVATKVLMTRGYIAHFVSPHLVSSGQPFYSHTILATCPQTPLQSRHRVILLRASPAMLLGIAAAARKRHRHIHHRKNCDRTPNAVDNICVSMLDLLAVLRKLTQRFTASSWAI